MIDKEILLTAIKDAGSNRAKTCQDLEDKVISLIPRMLDLRDVVLSCLVHDFKRDFFFTSRSGMRIGFFGENGRTDGKYFGMEGGGSCGSDLRVNLSHKKIVYQGTSMNLYIQTLRKIIKDFDEYESDIINFVNHLDELY